MKVFMLCLINGLMFWPVIGSAGLYKWTDDQGNFHITDTPPPGAQKKSASTAAPAPRPALPKKARVRPILPGQSRAEVHPAPTPIDPPPASEKVPIQGAMEGLSSSQATLTSAWQIFDGTQMNAKAPVQWWKDEQGLDHFVDVLPMARGAVEAGAKERPAGVSRSRYRTTE